MEIVGYITAASYTFPSALYSITNLAATSHVIFKSVAWNMKGGSFYDFNVVLYLKEKTLHKRNKQKREIIVYLEVYFFFSQVTASTMASKYYLELKIICCGSTRSTQRPSVCNYVCGDSNDFLYSLETCLVDMEVPKKRFICSEFLGERLSHRTRFRWRISTLDGPIKRSRTWCSRIIFLQMDSRGRFIFILKFSFSGFCGFSGKSW